jgi:ABC-type transporter Mla subunit MlaD
MIARETKLKLLAFAAVAVLGMSYLGFNYVGLDRLILGSGYDVAADFENSGGIFVNAEVTYRGTAVGRVTDMQLVDDGVRVTLTIDPDTEPIPADT